MSSNRTIQKEVIGRSIFHMNECLERINKCLSLLSAEQIWQKPNPELNSIGNLVLHLEGNITQYILSSLGSLADKRDRQSEFSANQKLNQEELLSNLKVCTSKACETIENISEVELLKKRLVQGFSMTGVEIIIHVVEHFSYHVGQIVLLTKQYTRQDLGFYANINLNTKNTI